MKEIKFLKTRNVTSPTRAHASDAGIDFYVPEFNKRFIEDLKEKNGDLFKEPMINNCVVTVSHSQNNSFDFDDRRFKFDAEKGVPFLILYPQERVLIPSGVHVKMGSQRALVAFNKSGVSTKYGLDVGACVVDEEYQGEIHLHLINTSNTPVKIYQDMKIVQFLELPIFQTKIKVTEGSVTDFYGGDTLRGAGGFGSTDKK